MLWTLWVTVALAGNRWAGLEGDLSATADVRRTPDEVTAVFADVDRARTLFGEACAKRWWPRPDDAPPQVAGVVVWTPSWVHRKLPIVVDEHRPGKRVSWDLQGDRGFYLVVDVKPRDGGATVTISTPLDPPGWPVRGLFFRTIRPAWAACYAAALLRLDPDAELRDVTGPAEPAPR